MFLLICGSGACLPVWAGNQALYELLKALHENGTIDTQTYRMVLEVAEREDMVQSPAVAEAGVKPAAGGAKGAGAETRPETGQDTVSPSPAEGDDLSIHIGGRLHVDAAAYSEDRLRHNDGTEIRRARLFAEGGLSHDWSYKLEYDFIDSGIDGLRDAYLDYNGFKGWGIRVGHFKEPFSLQNMNSSNYLFFMERGLPHLFTPSRNIGIGAYTGGGNWGLAAGVFGEGLDGAAGDNDEGYGLSARATFAPFLSADRLVHLGASVSHRVTGSEDTVRFRDRPESHVTDTRLVDTGDIDAEDFTRFGAEAAVYYGPLSVEGEYYALTLDRDRPANPDPVFSGYYLQGSWFLTGEFPAYDAGKGTFNSLVPRRIVGRGGFGAWQLALRFSRVDLGDEDIDGGEEENLALGLNWYPTPAIRFMANYINVLDVTGGPAAGDEPGIFQLRTQVVF